jgi:hypothetical protein
MFENHPGMRANALFWSLGTTASTANCARSNAGASPRESVFKVDIARARRRRRRNVRFVDAVALVQVFFSFLKTKLLLRETIGVLQKLYRAAA